MLRLGVFLAVLVAVGAIRFHELTNGETHFHGVPVEKYVASMNRIREISHILSGQKEPPVRFEDIEWAGPNHETTTLNPFLIEGDLVLTERQLDGLVESYEIELAKKEGRRFSRLFSIGAAQYLWDEFPITWWISKDDPPTESEPVRVAVKIWEDNTCLTFAENTSGADGSIEFQQGTWCSSNLGKVKQNTISLYGCSQYSIVHEIGHALGMFHEQERFDRDEHIELFEDNIESGYMSQFTHPQPYWHATNRSIPYNYGSVMHYSRFGFGKEYGLATLLPWDRNYNHSVGQRFELAFTDAKDMNLAYCDHVCPEKLPCLYGGYTDPKDCTKCRCPAGLDGTFCETTAYNHLRCGGGTRNATSEYKKLRANGDRPAAFKLVAPKGRKIQIVLTDTRFNGRNDSCNSEFVEIKYADQFESVGARFCDKQLEEDVTMTSATNEVLVIYKSTHKDFHFSIRYKFV